jgi:LPS-assembly protein
MRYDIGNGRWNQANHYATFQPNYVWSYAIGHRYLRDQPALGTNYGNNLITSRFTYRLNENYAFRMSHHFEARDGTMEEQYYTLYRDLRSWTTAITFRIRDNRNGPTDFTVAITFSLKAFPRFGLGTDRETPSLLLGG